MDLTVKFICFKKTHRPTNLVHVGKTGCSYCLLKKKVKGGAIKPQGDA